jgi:hypothetical protein
MHKMTLAAALLTALGGGTALAQGAPPNSAWSSSWPSYVQSQRALAANAHRFMEADARSNAKVGNGDRSMTAVTRNDNEVLGR